jgi:hypothetical protein
MIAWFHLVGFIAVGLGYGYNSLVLRGYQATLYPIVLLLILLLGLTACGLPGKFERELQVQGKSSGRTTFRLPDAPVELWRRELEPDDFIADRFPGRLLSALLPDGNLAVYTLSIYGLEEGEDLASATLSISRIDIIGQDGNQIASYPLEPLVPEEDTVQLQWSVYVDAPEPVIVVSTFKMQHNFDSLFDMLWDMLGYLEGNESEDWIESDEPDELGDILQLTFDCNLSAYSLAGEELWTKETGAESFLIAGNYVQYRNGRLPAAGVDCSQLVSSEPELEPLKVHLATIDLTGKVKKLAEMPLAQSYWDKVGNSTFRSGFGILSSGETIACLEPNLIRLSRQGRMDRFHSLDMVFSEDVRICPEGTVYVLAQQPPSATQLAQFNEELLPAAALRDFLKEQDTVLKVFDSNFSEQTSISLTGSLYSLLGVDSSGNALLLKPTEEGVAQETMDLEELGDFEYEVPVYSFELILIDHTGNEKWRIGIEDFDAPPTWNELTAYCGSNGYVLADTDTIHFFGLDGQPGWKYECEGEILDITPGDDNLLYVEILGELIAIGDG